MNLEDITLVILSHKRQHCLRKILQFYESTGIKILVLDNSPEPLSNSYIPHNCRYINSKESFAQRSARAARLIDTPYTIIGADDEVYLPSSLEMMREFLENNPDYVAVGGYAIAIWEYGPMIAATWAYPNTYKYHNNYESPLDRISLHTGEGRDPITSFFTCNLTRTPIVQKCLDMYSVAPVLATDAISVLTICGAGKSKYLDLVYWIRNWNQSPRSHSGWNRKMSLSDWWIDPRNLDAKMSFLNQLSTVYKHFTSEKNFSLAWDLILSSDRVLQSRISPIRKKSRELGEFRYFKSMKYFFKKCFAPKYIPKEIFELILELKRLNISVPLLEIEEATKIVSKLLPYKSWN